jgi:hypothetical protein
MLVGCRVLDVGWLYGVGWAIPSRLLLKTMTHLSKNVICLKHGKFSAINCTSPPFLPPQNDLGMYNWTETGSNPRPYAAVIKYWCPRYSSVKKNTFNSYEYLPSAL